MGQQLMAWGQIGVFVALTAPLVNRRMPGQSAQLVLPWRQRGAAMRG